MELVSLFNLITIGVVIFILVVYRYLDKSNRSLEKVKRFSDKVKENLSGFIEEKTGEIRNLSIDMQVNLKTAKEVLKRIGDIEVELKNKAESIDTLHQKVSEYDTLIHELNNATITVEENLKRIHDESAFIDKVEKRMKNAQGRIDQLERSIPAVREEIRNQNLSDLEEIKKAINLETSQYSKNMEDEIHKVEKQIKDFSLYIARLEERKESMEQDSINKLSAAIQRLEASMLEKKNMAVANLKNELKEALAEAGAKQGEFKSGMDELIQGTGNEVMELEDRMIKHLIEFKKDMEQAELLFKKNLSVSAEAARNIEGEIFGDLKTRIRNDADKINAEVTKKLQAFAKDADVKNNEVGNLISTIKQNAENWKTALAKKAEKMNQELNTHFANSKAEIDAKMTAFRQASDDAQKVFEASLASFVKDSENKILILGQENAKKIEEAGKQIAAFKSDFTLRLSEIDGKVDGEKEHIIAVFNEKLDALDKQLAVRFEKTKKCCDEIEGIGTDIDFRMKNIKKDLQECSCNLLGNIEELKSTLTENLENLSGDVESKVLKTVEERISEYENDSSYRLEKLERVQTDIEQLEQSLRSLMEARKDELKSDFGNFMLMLDAKKNEEREHTNLILSRIKEEIGKLDEEVNSLKTKAYQTVSEKLKVFEDEFFTDLKNRNAKMDSGILEWQDSVQRKLDGVSAELRNRSEKMDSGMLEWQDSVQRKLDGVSAELRNRNEKMDSGILEWQDSVQKKLDGVSAELRNRSEKMDSGILEWQDSVQKKLDGIREEHEKNRAAIEEEYGEELNQGIASMNDKLKNLFAAFEQRWQNTLAFGLDTSKQEFDKNMEAYRAEVKQILDEIREDFSTQKQELVSKTNEERKILKAELSSISSQVDAFEKGFSKRTKEVIDSFHTEYDRKQKDFIARIHELKAEFEFKVKEFKTALSDGTTQADAALKNTDAAYKNQMEIINRGYADLSEKMKSACEKQNELSSKMEIFDRASEFIGRIDKEIKLIKDEIDSLEPQRKKIKLVEVEFIKMRERVEKYIAEFGKLGTGIRNKYLALESEAGTSKARFTMYMQEIGKEVDAFRNEIKTGYDALGDESGQNKKNLENFIRTIENSFESSKTRLDEFMKNTERELSVSHSGLVKKLEEYETGLDEQLGTLEEHSGAELARIKQEFSSDRKEIVESASAERDQLKNDLVLMREKVTALKAELKDMGDKALSECQTGYQKLQDDFYSKSKLFEDTVGKKIGNFENNFKSEQEKIKQSYTKLAGKLDEEYKTLAENLREIGKQQQDFESQTKLFERADSLKISLKTEIEDLRKDLQMLDPMQKKMKMLDGELLKLNKLADEMNVKTTRFNSEKRRLDSMEKNFKQLLKISENIDDKLSNMTAVNDTLQEIRIKIRELEELNKEVQNQYERLEKKKEVIEATTTGVDKNFKFLEELEKEIRKINEEVVSLPPKVIAITEDIKFLSENKQKADSAVEQVQKMDALLSDIEDRTMKLKDAREWLARTETRLESIGKNTQDQLKLLKALVREDAGKDGGNNGKKGDGAPPQDRREMIVKLARQGWSPREISKATNTSVGEIELILELEPKVH